MSQPPRLLFLADSGAEIGGGHVMRSLTLAEEIVRQGGACAFVAPPDVQGILGRFGGGAVEALNVEQADIPTSAALAGAWRADWVFIDHYRLGRSDETALRAPGRRIAVLDDLAERCRDCDLLLDPSYGRRAETYAPLTPPGCEVLTGPVYALVRPQFAAMRTSALQRRTGGAPARGLVSLGLTDVGGITQRVVEALLPHLGALSLDVALGAKAPSLEPLRRLNDPRVRLHVETRDMAALISQADLAVGAGGSSTWERCCLGLPTVTLVLADNQRPLAEAFARDGISPAVQGKDLDGMVAAWLALAGDADERTRLSAAASALCDGMGAQRVAERLLRS